MSSLTHPEGAELLPVLVTRMAQDRGIRALLIKGQVAGHHGLRPIQLSNDVDILVEPHGFDALHRALLDNGWFGVESHLQPDIAAIKHSVALQHALWPLELDVHRSFPGMFASATDAFDALWDDRATLTLSRQSTSVAGLAGSVVIGLLHAWRNSEDATADREAALIEDFLREADQAIKDAVSELVHRTGASEAGRERWEALGIPVGPAIEVDGHAMLTWRWQTEIGRPLGWTYVLLQQPTWRRPRVVLRALLGTNERELRIRYPAAPAGRRGLWLARWWRLRTALHEMPTIVGLVRKHRRGR